jgi:hypothetical protein
MLKIKKHYQVEVNFNPVSIQQFTIGDQPQLRGVTTVAIEAYTSAQFTTSYNQNPVVPVATGLIVTLAIDRDGITKEDVYNLPYYSLVRSFNAGILFQLDNVKINWSKSYISIVNATGLTTGQSAVLSVYYL